MFFLGLITFVIVLAVSLTWILPIFISLVLSKKLNASVKIRRCGIIYLKLYDVEYVQNGIKVNFAEIGLNSSFINAEVKKLVTLVAHDVSITYNVQEKKNSSGNEEKNKAHGKKVYDYRNSKIPAKLPIFAQFMAVHIYNISGYIAFKTKEERGQHEENFSNVCLYAAAKELHLDGSIVQNSQTLLVNVNILEASARLLDSSVDKTNVGVKMKEKESLAELRFAFATEATLIAQGPLSFEKLSISIRQASAIVTDGFYQMVQKSSSGHKFQQFSNFPRKEDIITYPEAAMVDYGDAYARFAPIIPKNFVMRVDNTSLRGVRQSGHNDFAATLSNFLCSYRFYGANVTSTGNTMVPHMLSSFVIDDLVVRNSREQLVLLRRIKLDAKFSDQVVAASQQPGNANVNRHGKVK